jgi:hypothetical protein
MKRSLACVAYAALFAGAQSCGAGPEIVRPTDPSIAIMGRVDRSSPDRLRVGYPGVTLRLRFEGPLLAARLSSTTAASRLDVRVDGGPPRIIAVPKLESEVVLAEGLSGGPHTIEIVHRTETWQGIVGIAGFRLGRGGRLLPPLPWPARRLLFIGDSVTCGEAVDRAADCLKDPRTWNPEASYGMLLGHALDAQVHLVCYGGRGLVRDWRGKTNVLNAPQFFDLAVPADHGAPPWDHAAYVPDAVVVSLGTNDFNLDLGELPPRDAWVKAYVTFVGAIRAQFPQTHVFLTEGAIVNDDKDPSRPQKTVLRAYLQEVSRRLGDVRVHVVPSAHYPGDACNAHPTREQHAAMARDLEPEIRRALAW